MKSVRDSVTISFPVPSFCVYVLSFQYTIHQVIYRFDSELGVRFKLLTEGDAELPYQVYRAEGDICNEKLFLLENKQGKTYIIPAYKQSKYVLVVSHGGYLDHSVYSKMFGTMNDSPVVNYLLEQELAVMRAPALQTLLSNLD